MSQAIIDRVKRLLALTSSSNQYEAANAAAIANRLIDEYRLSIADLTESSAELDPMIEDSESVYETGRIIPWKSHLVSTLAAHYGCACYNSVTYPQGRKVSHMKLVGRKSDVELARYMIGWLMLECQRLCDMEGRGQGKIFASSYCQGFVAGVSAQLKTSRVEAEKAATGTAIIKINARTQESLDYMHSQHRLKSAGGASKARIDAGAYSAGREQGARVHLGASLGAGKARLLSA
jgi:hypothetical protein